MFALKPYYAPDFTLPQFVSAPDAVFLPAPRDGVAPEQYHAMSIFPEYFKVNGQWLLAEESRMDCVAVLKNGKIEIVEFRNLYAGDMVAIGRTENGEDGIYVHPDGFREDLSCGNNDAFAFRKNRSRETAFSRDYDELYQVLRHERDHGKIVWVMGPAFAFDYDALYEDYQGSSDSINIFEYLVTPVRGIVAIFVFIIALTGGLSWFKDKNSNTYANIPLNKRPSLKLLIISIPTVIAMLSGYLSLLVAGICSNYLYELFTMFAYGLLCIIVTYILSSVVNEHIYCGLIPVFILGSIICCPIFFNLANLIPAMKYLQNIFLPTYYFMF